MSHDGAETIERAEVVEASHATSAAMMLDGTERPVSVRWISGERVGGSILVLIFGALGVTGVILGITLGRPGAVWSVVMVAGLVVVVGVSAFLAYWYPGAAHRRMRYGVNDLGIEIRRGVWSRQVVSIPKTRVQHTDIEQGPLMRHFGYSKLIIHTAGTQHATVTLDGVEHDVAARIRDHLIGRRVGRDDE